MNKYQVYQGTSTKSGSVKAPDSEPHGWKLDSLPLVIRKIPFKTEIRKIILFITLQSTMFCITAAFGVYYY